MKCKIKVNLDELDTAGNWGMSGWNHYLDLEAGKVIGIDDETRWALEELIEEMYDEEDNQSITLEELLQQREDIQDWRKDARAKERLLRWLHAHDIEPST